MSSSTAEHRRQSPERVRCAVVTISDTRTLETDRGGALVAERLIAAGHEVAQREIVPDDAATIEALVQQFANDDLEAVFLTGGTGITARDTTFETISAMLTKPMPGYGELFRMLSFEQVGPAAMLSRAVGGVVGKTIVLTMPGSTAAVELAMDRLIVPEIAYLVHEARK